jgi:predicted phage terminase large subunit-like protein
MFNQIDPAVYIHNWHIDAICEHLEAIFRREIRNLLITIQFRSMKSTVLDVMFPAWVWLHKPEEQFLVASYNHGLAKRDNIRCRRLIQSPKYQSRWGHRFSLREDLNTITKFENSFGGYKIAVHVGGATGDGGNILVIDDAHNILEAESKAEREAVIRWYREVWSGRMNNPANDCSVVTQQCTHAEDLAAYVRERKEAGDDWEHLNIPSRYEKKFHCSTSLGWSDPRTEEGELFWPERFDEKSTKRLEGQLGHYAASAQMQQNPIPRAGKTFDAENFREILEFPSGIRIINAVRYWDKAGTEGGGKRTAGVLMFRMRDGGFIVYDCLAGQWSVARREGIISAVLASDTELVRNLTRDSNYMMTTWIEQEPGSSGKESSSSTITSNPGYVVKADRVTGSKVSRAEPYAVQVAAGNVQLLKGKWVADFVEEHEMFPGSAFKDRVDSAAGAFSKLSGTIKVAGVW